MPLFAIYGLVGLGLLIAGFVTGWETRGWRDDSSQLAIQKAQLVAVAAAAADARQKQQAVDQIGFTIGQSVANVETKIQTLTMTRIQDVPVVYISPKANRACSINAGTVKLLNLAASGRDDSDPALALPPGATNDSPTTTSLAEVASSVVANYGLDRECRARLEAWSEWAGKVKEAWDKAVPLRGSR